jgi:hypothetical protein
MMELLRWVGRSFQKPILRQEKVGTYWFDLSAGCVGVA